MRNLRNGERIIGYERKIVRESSSFFASGMKLDKMKRKMYKKHIFFHFSIFLARFFVHLLGLY